MPEPHPMRASIFAASLTLCAALTACSTLQVRAQAASPCMKILLASGLLDPTAAPAIALIDGTAGGLGAHDIALAGQLVKANIDKATAKKLGTSCDAEWDATLKAATRKRFLGIF